MNRTTRFALAFALAVLDCAVPALAEPGQPAPSADQTAGEPTSTTIVVKGKRAEGMKLVRDIRAISLQADGQLARFQQPICPLVRGLSAAYVPVIEARIAALAEVARLKVDKPGCKPNLTLIVTTNAPQFITALKSTRPALLNSVLPSEFRALVANPGPAWSWQTAEPKRADGAPVRHIDSLEIGNGPPMPLSRGAYQIPNANMSRITETTRQDIDHAFVIIDRASIAGLSLQQIGDYAGMAGLTGAKLHGTERLAMSSILNMFAEKADDVTPVDGATEFDLAYLKARYSGTPSQNASQETKTIAISVMHELEKPAGSH